MKIIKTTPVLILLLTLTFLGASCSNSDDSETIKGTSTQQAQVYPIGVGLQRKSDTKIFISELPYESYDNFDPLTSVEVSEDLTIVDPVTIDVKEYTGKTVYFVALRKYLFSDNYYNITSTTSAPLTDHNATIEAVDSVYKVSLVLSEPTSTDYWDKSRLTLTVQRNGAVVPSKEVYWFGTTLLWSDEMKQSIETRYMADGSVAYPSMTQTNADGVLAIDIPVNEAGIVEGENGATNYNEHVFFVIDNGVVQPVIVDITSLEVEQTLSY